MNTANQILRTRCTKLNKLLITLRLSSTTSADQIEIPKRIHRGPTDILQALESTISRDPTATHYKYHDDPYLIPMSNIGKRTFALAQEAGKKAAHWVREQHSDLFQHKECDPPVAQFFPKMVYNEKSEVTEGDLQNAISDVLVMDASLVYKMLKDKGVEISNEVLISFLDLLCFYNNEDTLSEAFLEERWHKLSNRGKERSRKTWKDGALAEEIFISIENPTGEAYSSLIQGMAKHFQVERALQLFEEAQTKQLQVNVEAYNAIISVSNFLKENYEMRWNFVTETLSAMNAAKVKPNLGTLNAVLEAVSTMGVGRHNKQNALKIISEFRALGVEPSLGSWYLILITFCKERGPVSFVLKDILPHLEDKEHCIRDIRDTYFFVTAMDICRNHLHDRDLAQRVNKLLHFGNNYDLLGDSFKESIYYRHYFILMCSTEPLDEFISKIYNTLVPHIYVPEPAVMLEVLQNVEVNAALEYLPKLWSDMMIFDHTDRENLLTTVLNIMVNNKPADAKMDEQFANIAWNVWEKIENQSPNRIHKLAFTGEILGNIMTVVLRHGDFEKACDVMNKLDKGLSTVVGVPKVEALEMFVDHCITKMRPSKAIQCIQYCTDCGYAEADSFAIKLHSSMTLDESHLEKLSKIVDDHVLGKKDAQKQK